MDKKFELTNESIAYEGRTLYRVRALKDFLNVKKGDLGGFIEKESNLSQEGNCWICSDAKVFSNAMICNNAVIYDNAIVCDDAIIHDNAKVYNNAIVYGCAIVHNDAKIYGDAEVFGNVEVWDSAEIYNNATVYDNAKVFGNAAVYGDARVSGNTKIYDNAEIYGSVKICGNAILKEDQVVHTGCCRVDLSKNLKENIRCQTNLFPQKDCVIAYKQVNKDLTSLYDNTFQYKINEWVEVENPDMSNAACATGLHFSNMNYWDRISGNNTTYLMAKIMLDDIITVQRGKIRCKRAFILDKYEIEN